MCGKKYWLLRCVILLTTLNLPRFIPAKPHANIITRGSSRAFFLLSETQVIQPLI